MEVNTDFGHESEQETKNSSSDSMEISDDDTLCESSDILRKSIIIPA